MDQRQTFNDMDELKCILLHLCSGGSMVSMLVDIDGLTRVCGKISKVNFDELYSNSIVFESNKQEVIISLREIVAANGIFNSDYSEC
jgi:hypothetical protein